MARPITPKALCKVTTPTLAVVAAVPKPSIPAIACGKYKIVEYKVVTREINALPLKAINNPVTTKTVLPKLFKMKFNDVTAFFITSEFIKLCTTPSHVVFITFILP